MKETRAVLTTVTAVGLFLGLVTVSPILISVGIVSGIALLLHGGAQ